MLIDSLQSRPLIMNCSKHSLSRHSPSTSCHPPRLHFVRRGCSCWCGFYGSLILFFMPWGCIYISGGEADGELSSQEHIVGYSSPSSWSCPIVNSPLIHGLILVIGGQCSSQACNICQCILSPLSSAEDETFGSDVCSP